MYSAIAFKGTTIYANRLMKIWTSTAYKSNPQTSMFRPDSNEKECEMLMGWCVGMPAVTQLIGSPVKSQVGTQEFKGAVKQQCRDESRDLHWREHRLLPLSTVVFAKGRLTRHLNLL